MTRPTRAEETPTRLSPSRAPDPVLDQVGRLHADGTLRNTSAHWHMGEVGSHLAELVAEEGRAAVESALRAALGDGEARARGHRR